jgi:ferredoxin
MDVAAGEYGFDLGYFRRMLEAEAVDVLLSHKMIDDPEQEEMLWKVREGGLGATAWVPGQPDGWPGWEDSAVAPEKAAGYVRELKALFDRYDYRVSVDGHFGRAKLRSFMDDATDLVVKYGGSLSGEHGDGQARGEYLPKMCGDKLCQAFREFESIWDPDWKINPGKVIDASRIDDNLRLGADYDPPRPQTHFRYPADESRFDRAVLRCVGVGACRNAPAYGGVMCPRYRATMEEKHSTRGRADLLWEMMNGEVLTDGWRSEAVKEALDLCLACKGCKSDCPVQVAEFLSHDYEGRLRPRHAYSMGWIPWWAELASLAPSLANVFSQTPLLRDLSKWLGGLRPGDVPLLVRPAAGPREGGRRSSCGRTRSTTTSTLRSPEPQSRFWRPPAIGSGCRGRTCAADGPCTTSACSTRRRPCCGRSSIHCGHTCGRACRWSASSRAASPSSATS